MAYEESFSRCIDMNALLLWPNILFVGKIWNDNCQAHEAYQFFRKKNAEKYAGNIPPPAHLSKAEMKRKK